MLQAHLNSIGKTGRSKSQITLTSNLEICKYKIPQEKFVDTHPRHMNHSQPYLQVHLAFFFKCSAQLEGRLCGLTTSISCHSEVAG